MLITVVADDGTGDPAFAEVRQTFAELLPGADLAALPVPPFDTGSAGFSGAQPALGTGPADRVVDADAAPREDDAGGNTAGLFRFPSSGASVRIVG